MTERIVYVTCFELKEVEVFMSVDLFQILPETDVHKG